MEWFMESRRLSSVAAHSGGQPRGESASLRSSLLNGYEVVHQPREPEGLNNETRRTKGLVSVIIGAHLGGLAGFMIAIDRVLVLSPGRSSSSIETCWREHMFASQTRAVVPRFLTCGICCLV